MNTTRYTMLVTATREKLVLLGLAALITGCTSQELKPGMVALYTMPKVSIEKDPEADFSKYTNFTTFPVAESLKEVTISPIIEKQLLFMTRNHIPLPKVKTKITGF